MMKSLKNSLQKASKEQYDRFNTFLKKNKLTDTLQRRKLRTKIEKLSGELAISKREMEKLRKAISTKQRDVQIKEANLAQLMNDYLKI